MDQGLILRNDGEELGVLCRLTKGIMVIESDAIFLI